jgi:NADH-quinone oxidoreductase subunit C
MTIDDAAVLLNAGLSDVTVEVGGGKPGDPWLTIPSASVLPALRFLRDELGYAFLSNLSGVDDGTSLTVVYHVARPGDAGCLALKTVLPRDAAVVESVSGLYGNAGWFEREAFDLLGIRFQNHPDLRRLMMPDDWEGHPLRKDYSPPAEYHGIPCDRPDSHRVLDVLYPKHEGSEVSSKSQAPAQSESGPLNPNPKSE